MLSAHSLVCILSTNTHLLSHSRHPFRKERRRPVPTKTTLRPQLGILVGKRNQIQHSPKGSTLRITVQTKDKHVLSLPLNKLQYHIIQIRKELRLLNNHIHRSHQLG